MERLRLEYLQDTLGNRVSIPHPLTKAMIQPLYAHLTSSGFGSLAINASPNFSVVLWFSEIFTSQLGVVGLGAPSVEMPVVTAIL